MPDTVEIPDPRSKDKGDLIIIHSLVNIIAIISDTIAVISLNTEEGRRAVITLAYALIANGSKPEGETILERFGRM